MGLKLLALHHCTSLKYIASVVCNRADCLKEQGHLPVESMKPSITFECQKFDSRKHNQSSSTDSFDNFSVTKAPVASVNWANFTACHFQKSKKSNSERPQFPMFDINRKIDTILGQMKRTGYGTNEVRINGQKLLPGESSLSPHLIEFASEEHQVQQQRLAETTNEEMLTEEDNDLFNSKVAYEEHCLNTNIGHSTFALSGRKNDDERALGRFQSSRTGRGISCHDRLIKSNQSCCNVGIVRTNGTSSNTRNKGTLKHTDATPLFTKKMDMDLCHKDPMVGESSVPANVKGNSFFDMLSLPALFHRHSQRGENSAPPVDSTNTKHSEEIDANLMDKKNEHSSKTDIMCTDVLLASTSTTVGIPKSQKDVAYDTRKLTGITGTNSELMSSKYTSTSRSESMDATWKWAKRLRPNTLNAIPIATKRLKLGDSSSGVEVENMVNQVVTYGRSISSLPEIQQLEKAQSSSGDSVKDIPWIRRWCRPSQEMSSVQTLYEPERTNVMLEKLQAKHFSSLSAMAMMGKSVNNFRPSEFRKRGSTTVWSTGNSDTASQIVLTE